MLSLTECVGDFHNNALKDTHCHALVVTMCDLKVSVYFPPPPHILKNTVNIL